MHEGQTPNGVFIEPLNYDDSQQPPRVVSCPFYSVIPDENIFKESTKSLQLLAPAKTVPDPELGDAETIIESEFEKVPPLDDQEYAPGAIQAESVESDSDETETNSEFEKLIGLNQELQSANSNLYNRVSELTSALSESETALHQHIKRFKVTESMFNQQTQELSAAQEQIKLLFEQMENAVQTTQRQGSLIESYKTQLEVNQQRLAQLERECTLIQTKYNEQTHQLLHSENSCRELRTRLKRQQRQTLQFKAALEKCLDTPVPSYDGSEERSDRQGQEGAYRCNHTTQPYPHSHSVSNGNIERIQPWSVEDDTDTNGSFHEELFAYPASPPQTEISTPTWTRISPDENTDESVTDSPNDSQIDPALKFGIEYQSEILPPSSTDLQQQLDSVIESFFANEPPADNSVKSIPVWKTIVTPNEGTSDDRPWKFLVDDEEEPVLPTNPILDANDITDDYWTEVSQFPSHEFDSPNPNTPLTSLDHDQTNSPSPVLYPQRPPKGRKSLASVELPNFRPQQ